MRAKATVVALFLWCGAVSAQKPPRDLQVMPGGVAYRIGGHAGAAGGIEAALAQAEASAPDSPRTAALLNLLGDQHRSQHRYP